MAPKKPRPKMPQLARSKTLEFRVRTRPDATEPSGRRPEWSEALPRIAQQSRQTKQCGGRRRRAAQTPRRRGNRSDVQQQAVPAPPADVRNKSVEEIVQGWKASLEADVKEFTTQTEQLREWENEIRASQREIVEVSAYAEKLVVAQQRTEKVLDEVRAYQDDLDGDLDAMERHVDDLFARSAVRPPLDADVEREHAYDLSVRLETQLGGMLDQLKDVVTKLNLSHDESGDEKSRDIMKIVNAHHQSLAYLSAQASKIEAEVVKLERANEAERRAQAV